MDFDYDSLSLNVSPFSLLTYSYEILDDDISEMSINSSDLSIFDAEISEESIEISGDDHISIINSILHLSTDSDCEDCLSIHDSDSSTNHSSVMTPDPIFLLERLDEMELPVRGNIIPTPAINFDFNQYLSQEFMEDKNSISIHPLVSILDPESISIDGSLHKTAQVTVGPEDVFDHILDEDCPPPLPEGMSETEWAGYVEEALQQAVQYCPLLVPGNILTSIAPSDLLNFKEYLLMLRKRFRQDGLELLAANAAKGVNWDSFNFCSDINDLIRHNGNMAALCDTRQKLLEPDGLNLNRVRTHLAGYPLLRKVEKLVDHGIHIYPDPKYKKNPFEQLRPQEIKLASCLCQNALKMHEKGKILIFQIKDLTPSQLRHVNFNASFWVPKVDCDEGRICVDPSNRSDGRMPLNGGQAKVLGCNKYGKVLCFQMVDLVVDWIIYKNLHDLSWSEIWLAKEDCKTYFNQFKFHPKSCLHMCRRIAEGILILELFGNYGHTVLPSGAQVLGHAMQWKLRQEIKCPLHLYFDDFMIMGTYMHCFEAAKATQLLIKNVLGPGGLAINKSCFSQMEVILGYLVNMLDPRGASIGPKLEAIDKMLHIFFNFDASKRQSLHFWQVRASYAERYSQVLVGMRPFVSAFHHMVSICSPTARDLKLKSNHRRVKREVATPLAQFAIEVWRFHLLLLWKDPSRFSLSLEQYVSFNGKGYLPPKYLGISDACYKGIAVAIFTATGGLTPLDPVILELVAWIYVPLGTYIFKLDPKTKKLDTSRFQNYLEYMGTVLQFILFNIFFPLKDRFEGFPSVLSMNSDSRTALSWQKKNKCSTQHSQVVCWVMTYLQIHSKIQVSEFKHISAIDPFMQDIDRESRRDLPLESLLSPGVYCDNLPHEKELDIREYPIIETFVEMVNPTKDFCLKGQYHENYVKVVKEFEPFVYRSFNN
jgi:hypothetical protein